MLPNDARKYILKLPFCYFYQFYTDRAYHLAQIKYLLMLRWRRFCRHTSVIEKLYPAYKVTHN